jgi:copper chaperone CopZ
MERSMIILEVPGMTCGHCEAAVKQELARVPGVEHVDVDLATKLVTIAGSDFDLAALTAAVDEAGYEVVGHRAG